MIETFDALEDKIKAQDTKISENSEKNNLILEKLDEINKNISSGVKPVQDYAD